MQSKLPNTQIKYLLEKASTSSDTLIFYVPGLSGNIFNGHLDIYVKESLSSGVSFLAVQCWENKEQLENKTIRELHAEIKLTYDFVVSQGYKKVIGVGKSFGGTLLLLQKPVLFSKLVLLAPPIGTADKNNYSEFLDLPLSQVKSIFEICISCETLSQFSTPTALIHGEDDKSVSLESSKRVASCLPYGKFISIPKMGHTPVDSQYYDVFKHIINFVAVN